MEKKKTKYDTNPLDPDFPRRTEEVSGATENVSRESEDPTRRLETEAPTRRWDGNQYNSTPTSYPSVFVPPTQQPPAAQPAPFVPPVQIQQPTSRNIPGIGMPENVVLILPYIPFYLGSIAALAELYLVPRHETRVRFHAAQGLALHLAVLAVQFLLGIITSIVGGGVGRVIFSIASIVFFIVSMIRVWSGQPHHIAPLDDATKWLNEKIEPRN